ncbi:anti-sigma factor [Catenuloplanes atrovinosus]|uniref:Anti-sigma K factor RskA C-terminal domain-containing protein n=1 Tax=Catenuloplanes atrovinosus TaxID=137266 RepID=A0AAE3YMC3_9ACTN|nr:anti-sigma factor [Catenuloplanes atrovinosus]MDR7275095.1 hypothetical protein [Catenuloplanes atrovinosus]
MTDAESPRDHAPGTGAGRGAPGQWFGTPDDEELEDFPDAPAPYPPPPGAPGQPADPAGGAGSYAPAGGYADAYPLPDEPTAPLPPSTGQPGYPADPRRATDPGHPPAEPADYWPVPPREPVEAGPERGRGRRRRDVPAGPVAPQPAGPVSSVAGPARPHGVPSDARRGSRRPWALPLAALAAAAALTAGVLVVNRVLTPPNPFLEGGTEYAATGADGATGTVRLVPTGTGTGVVLEPDGLPAAPEGSYYAAWLRGPDGATVPLGSFHERRTGIPIFLWSAVEPAAFPELVVTLQSENDQPGPTGPEVLTARLG